MRGVTLTDCNAGTERHGGEAQGHLAALQGGGQAHSLAAAGSGMMPSSSRANAAMSTSSAAAAPPRTRLHALRGETATTQTAGGNAMPSTPAAGERLPLQLAMGRPLAGSGSERRRLHAPHHVQTPGRVFEATSQQLTAAQLMLSQVYNSSLSSHSQSQSQSERGRMTPAQAQPRQNGEEAASTTPGSNLGAPKTLRSSMSVQASAGSAGDQGWSMMQQKGAVVATLLTPAAATGGSSSVRGVRVLANSRQRMVRRAAVHSSLLGVDDDAVCSTAATHAGSGTAGGFCPVRAQLMHVLLCMAWCAAAE